MKKLLFLILILAHGLRAEIPQISTVAEALRQPQSKFFWIERHSGRITQGDPVSRFDASRDAGEITFDIGNNKALANLSPNGMLKALTIYRASYRACCNPNMGWPGVWVGKDNSSYGAYAYNLEVGGDSYDLSKVDWDYHTGLLDNIFPVTELREPQGRFVVRLLTFAPVSADGVRRLRGIIYGLQLENTSRAPLRGTVHLPKPFQKPYQGDRPKLSWAMFDPYDFELGLGDAPKFSPSVSFNLEPGGSVWVPTILCQPGEPTVAEINERGTLAWLQESWRYYRGILGRIQTPGEPWFGEFFEREVLQSLLAVAMDGTGKLAGSNWGSYPATRQIWTKDFFYSGLPFMALEPTLAQKLILWFDEFGVRQPGEVVTGGLNHSISLSVASVVMAGLYYEQTGDKTFFFQHPELKERWAVLLNDLVATRQDPNVWLLPTRYISDGKLDCDWHCGSNVAVWRAMQGFARLQSEVYGDAAQAQQFAAMADKVRAALLEKTVIAGPYGPQFIEGVNRDGKVPRLTSDGEESDTSLMPFYGFLPYDDARYLNYMRFSMSTNNAQYTAATRSINWGSGVPATAPGYNKGLCAGLDRESLLGEHGYYTEIRRVTEVDGSVWWWPWQYNKNKQLEIRRFPGKAGWFAGVHSVLFMHRFLGIAYDAPTRKLHFSPQLSIGDFEWKEFPLGSDRFSISYRQGVATLKNSCAQPVSFQAGKASALTVAPGATATQPVGL